MAGQDGASKLAVCDEAFVQGMPSDVTATELQRGSRKAKARERNIGRKGSGAGPGGGRGNKTAKRRSFNEEAGKPKHANET